MNTELFLNTIKTLRFPLTVLVVLIHSAISGVIVGGQEFIFDVANFPFYANFSFLISRILGSIAVPLFFVFSGFLFFYKIENFTAKIYKNKILKRIKTLFVPYIFWNLCVFLLSILMQIFIPNLAGARKFAVDYTFWDYLNIFWCVGGTSLPMCGQFWFIRDLMMLCLLAPIIYFLIKKLKIYYISALGILYLFSAEIPVLGLDCLFFSGFFFSVGAFLAIEKIEIFAYFSKFKKIAFALTFLMILFLMLNLNFQFLSKKLSDIALNLSTIFSMISCVILTANLIENKGKTFFDKVGECNFFLYATHAVLVAFLNKILLKSLALNDFSATLIYVVTPVVIVVSVIFVFRNLKRFLPKFTEFITGGRV